MKNSNGLTMDYHDRIILIHDRILDLIRLMMESTGRIQLFMPDDSDISVVWHDARTGLPYGCRVLDVYLNYDSISAYLEERYSLDNFILHSYHGDWLKNIHALIKIAAIVADAVKHDINHLKTDDMNMDFSEQIEQLRKEITRAIIGLFRKHGLTGMEFPDPISQPNAPDSVYVIFFDDDGDPFECVVEKVEIDGDGLNITASDKHGQCRFQTACRFDLSLRSPIWLNDIFLTAQSLLETGNTNLKTS